MQFYITVSPEQYRLTAGMGMRLSHLAYQIGNDGHLHRRAISKQTQNGLLSLGHIDPPPLIDPSCLCREVLRECTNRGFEGASIDFGATVTPDRVAFLEELERLMRRSGRKLFVSASYGRSLREAYVLINTALSGGTLHTLLTDACQTFGTGRIAMDIERVCMDFLLPSPNAEGQPLSRAAFHALCAEISPSIFFSHELCAKYFTYQRNGSAHFVLFDDADTIRFKMKLAQNMSLPCAFLLCSEVEDLLPELRERLT